MTTSTSSDGDRREMDESAAAGSEQQSQASPATPRSRLCVAGIPLTIAEGDIAVQLVQNLLDIARTATLPPGAAGSGTTPDYRTRLDATIKLLEFVQPVDAEGEQAEAEPAAGERASARRKTSARKKAPPTRKTAARRSGRA